MVRGRIVVRVAVALFGAIGLVVTVLMRMPACRSRGSARGVAMHMAIVVWVAMTLFGAIGLVVTVLVFVLPRAVGRRLRPTTSVGGEGERGDDRGEVASVHVFGVYRNAERPSRDIRVPPTVCNTLNNVGAAAPGFFSREQPTPLNDNAARGQQWGAFA